MISSKVEDRNPVTQQLNCVILIPEKHRQSQARINMKASFTKQASKTTCMSFILQISSNLHKWTISNVSTWKKLKVLRMSAEWSLHNSSNILNQQCCSLLYIKYKNMDSCQNQDSRYFRKRGIRLQIMSSKLQLILNVLIFSVFYFFSNSIAI